MYKSVFIVVLATTLTTCGVGETANQTSNTVQVSSATEPFSDRSQDQQTEQKQTASSVDICRCLTEPGNSDWSIQNKEACRDAISDQIGVENWEKINFSQNPDLNRKWDELVEKCTGSKEVKTGVASVDVNNTLVPEIGTSYGYIWESINVDAQIYTTLAFDGLIFRTTAYSMNGETNSENFTKLLDVSGKWEAVDLQKAVGVISQNNVSVSWQFSEDFSYLTNNKGVVFKRVRVR